MTHIQKRKPGRPKGTKTGIKTVHLSTTLPPDLKEVFCKLGGAKWLRETLLREQEKLKD